MKKDENTDWFSEEATIKALEMRKQILGALSLRFMKEKLSKRKNKDGSLAYQSVLNRLDKGTEEVPTHYMNFPKKDD